LILAICLLAATLLLLVIIVTYLFIRKGRIAGGSVSGLPYDLSNAQILLQKARTDALESTLDPEDTIKEQKAWDSIEQADQAIKNAAQYVSEHNKGGSHG